MQFKHKLLIPLGVLLLCSKDLSLTTQCVGTVYQWPFKGFSLSLLSPSTFIIIIDQLPPYSDCVCYPRARHRLLIKHRTAAVYYVWAHGHFTITDRTLKYQHFFFSTLSLSLFLLLSSSIETIVVLSSTMMIVVWHCPFVVVPNAERDKNSLGFPIESVAYCGVRIAQ